jgi:hypothetical protein
MLHIPESIPPQELIPGIPELGQTWMHLIPESDGISRNSWELRPIPANSVLTEFSELGDGEDVIEAVGVGERRK